MSSSFFNIPGSKTKIHISDSLFRASHSSSNHGSDIPASSAMTMSNINSGAGLNNNRDTSITTGDRSTSSVFEFTQSVAIQSGRVRGLIKHKPDMHSLQKRVKSE